MGWGGWDSDILLYGLKEISQNLDNKSQNSENQKKDKVWPKMAQKCQIVSLL